MAGVLYITQPRGIANNGQDEHRLATEIPPGDANGGCESHFQNYHRVLNRARWKSRAANRILLGLLVRTFVSSGPILVGLDDTFERRWGKQMQARGVYRDPVRSSRSHFVKTSGLRWLSLMLLAQIP